MNRLAEVEVLAALLSEPCRGIVRRSADAIRAGRFDGGAIAMLLRRRPELRWFGLLLALEVAELRLAGSVRFHTPRRYCVDAEGDFREVWGEWALQVFPCEAMVKLALRRGDRGWVLIAEGDRDYGGGPHPGGEAVEVFREALESFAGVPVEVVRAAA